MRIINDKSLILNEIKSHLNFKTDKDFADFLGIKPTTLSSWYSRNTFDYELLYAKCNFINADFLFTGRGIMEKNESKNEIRSVGPSEGVPLIPLDAMAGWGNGDTQVMDYEAGRYVVPEFEQVKADFMIRVKGSSMYPKYNSGDIVACRKLPLDTFFQWNKVYVLDTSQGPMIKRIKKSEKDKHLLCVSDNKDYDPFDIHTDDIHNLALVVGVIRLE